MTKHRFGFFAKLAFVAILVFLAISIVNQNIRINSLKEQQKKLEAERNSYSLQVERLNAELNEEVSEETIKRIAREKLNLREPGNVVYANDLPN
ncbi:MAG: cell division protein FtsL [Clostridia bacterium]|nr:cell division protein FtsL [Clostridia bacterium]